MKVCERFIKIKRVKSCSHKGSRFYKTSTELSKTLANEIWHTQSSGLHLVVHSNHSPKVKMATKWHDCGLTSIFLWQAYSCAHIDVRSPLSWNWSHSNAYGWHHEACMCLPFKSWKRGSAFIRNNCKKLYRVISPHGHEARDLDKDRGGGFYERRRILRFGIVSVSDAKVGEWDSVWSVTHFGNAPPTPSITFFNLWFLVQYIPRWHEARAHHYFFFLCFGNGQFSPTYFNPSLLSLFSYYPNILFHREHMSFSGDNLAKMG